MLSRVLLFLAVGALLLSAGVVHADSPRSIALLNFEMVNVGAGSGVTDDEAGRVAMVKERLREGIERSDGYSLFTEGDIDAAIAEAAGGQRFRTCDRCHLRAGQMLGSDLILVGWVDKVSNLILKMNVVVREVDSGQVVLHESADFRGNTDTAWLRAANSILRTGFGIEDMPNR